ncbi:MAG: SAM-dependent chlorinase/fluorinase [Bacteroidales bacterium]|nr:SAM-dependent chlorinase/fluorinase [Bacteroidales bacterium]MBN2763725.1 SAM-dependent chlorinase/fluorinase [Bacteroidales bacterium]
MAVITITSDWNKNDYYLAALKGRILSNCPEATIVDITHQVLPFNNAQAAFILRNCFRNFPEGSIHLICVNTESSADKHHIVIKASKQFFIGCDNGIFGLLLDEDPEEIITLKKDTAAPGSFSELYVFADCACNIIRKKKWQEMGSPAKSFMKQTPMRPTIDDSTINGSVIYIDSYRNAITNISRDLFERVRKGRPFDIFVRSNYYKINRINKNYSDSSTGEMLAIFNALGLLEIAINCGNAADLLNLGVNSVLRIKFYD